MIDPEEAAILRELFTRVAAGDSIRSIARSFRTRHPSRFGGRWGISYLTDIVRKPIYCGDIVHNGEVVAHNPEWAIIDKALWTAANARLNRQPRMRARSDRERPWMDGYVYHSCGSLATSRPDGSGRLNFKCNGEGNQQRCNQPRGSISYPMLDHAIKAALRMDLGSIKPPEETIAYAQELVGGKRALAARTTIDRRQARAQSKYERLLDLYGDGAISKQVLDERIAAVTEELDAIKAERAALPEPPDEDEIRATFAMMSTFADALDALEPGDWRELLAAVGRAVFDETGVRIEYLPEIAPHVTAHTIPAPRWSRAPIQA